MEVVRRRKAPRDLREMEISGSFLRFSEAFFKPKVDGRLSKSLWVAGEKGGSFPALSEVKEKRKNMVWIEKSLVLGLRPSLDGFSKALFVNERGSRLRNGRKGWLPGSRG